MPPVDDTYYSSVTLMTPSAGLLLPPQSFVDISATGGGSTITRTEGADTTNYVFTATRHGDLSAAGSVAYAVTGSTSLPGDSAAAAADFAGGVLPTGTISFAPGQFTQTVTIPVAGDTQPEPDEAFAVTLANLPDFIPGGGITLGDTITAYGAIINDDTASAGSSTDGSYFQVFFPFVPIVFDTGDRTTGASYITIDQALAGILYDGDNGYPQTMTYMVERTGHLGAEAVVTWQLTGTGATPVDGTDFTGGVLPSGTITFAPGYSNQYITVNFTGDTSAKPDGGYLISLATTAPDVTIGAPTPDQGDQSSLAGLLVHRSRYIAITATDADKPEGNSGSTPFVFTVTRSALSPEPAASETVTWKVVTIDDPQPDPATVFAPGFAQTGTITFAPGELSQALTIAIGGDTIAEPDQQFTVLLTGASPGESIAQPQAYGTVRNDDINFAVAANTPSQNEGNSGATPFVFTITRTGGTATDSVYWTTIGATAHSAGPSDLLGGVPPSGFVTFAPGQTTQTVTVMVAGDTQVEPDEGFQVVLLGPSPGTQITTDAAQAVITNDDSYVTIAQATPGPIFEGSQVSYTLHRTGATAAPATVTWQAAGDGPNPVDFAGFSRLGPATGVDPLSLGPGAPPPTGNPGVNNDGLPTGTVTFAAGVTDQTITLNFADDDTVGPDEGFRITLATTSSGVSIGAPAPVSPALGRESSVTGLLLNVDRNVTITALDADKPEGNSGPTPFTFLVTRTALAVDPGTTDTVQWAVDSIGIDASDLAPGFVPYGTLTFAPGVLSQTITVAIAGDLTPEPDEAFGVLLTGASPGEIINTDGASIAYGTIRNDDITSFAIAANTPSQNEGNTGATPFVFTITRTGGTATDSVYWTTIGATAHSAGASDLLGGAPPSGTVTFAPGQTTQTVTVMVAGDTQVEPDEAFQVLLLHPSAGTRITTGAAQAVITNDDTGLSIAADTPRQNEGNSGATPYTFTISRTGLLAAGDSVRWTTVGLGPHSANPADFTGGIAPSGNITFAAGEANRSITLDVAGDTTVEPDEGFRVLLLAPSPGVTVTTGSASAEILNDDSAPLAADAFPAPGMTFLASVDFNGDGQPDQLLQTASGALDIATPHGVTEIGQLTQGRSFAGLTDSGAILLHDSTAGAADPWTVLSPAGVAQCDPAWPPG